MLNAANFALKRLDAERSDTDDCNIRGITAVNLV